MPTFRNISDQLFQDGNIEVRPGQTLTADSPDRIDQLTNQYGWQFECLEAPEAEAVQEVEAPEANDEPATPAQTDLRDLKKDELLAHADALGIEGLPKRATNDEIIAAIEAHEPAEKPTDAPQDAPAPDATDEEANA